MKRSLLAVCGVLLVAAAFQVFLRYQYIHTAGLAVMRIDRISGSSCYMPCLPPPPTPQPTAFDFDAAVSAANNDAIAIVRAQASTNSIIAQAPSGSEWRAQPANDGDHGPGGFFDRPYAVSTPSPGVVVAPTSKPTIDQVRLVYYTPSNSTDGFYWEVRLETKRAYYVNGDAALASKYQVRRQEPTASELDAAVLNANKDAIALVKALPNLYSTIALAKPNSKWNAKSADPLLDPDRYIDALPLGTTPRPKQIPYRVRLVSFADAKGSGYFWEVHLDTSRVYFVNDDAA